MSGQVYIQFEERQGPMKQPGSGTTAPGAIPGDPYGSEGMIPVLDALQDAVFVLDQDMRIVLVNEAFRRCRARQEEPEVMTGQSLPEAFPMLPKEVLGQFRAVYATGRALTTDIITTLDARRSIHECRITPAGGGDQVTRIVAVMRDVTAQRNLEEERRAAQERYQVVVENANEAIFVTQNEKVIFINPKALEIAGYDQETLTSRPFTDFVHPDDKAMVFQTYKRRLAGEDVPGSYVFRFLHATGNILYTELHAALVTWDGKPAALNFLLDVTERMKHQDQLYHMARHDPLTGAYNRHCLNELLDIETRRSQRYTGTIGFLMMDINHFKEINDTHGHQTGDGVLKAVADILNSQVRDVDYVVRYGGDEYLLVMPQTATESELVKKRIADAFARWNLNESPFEFPVTVSMGCAHWSPGGAESIEAALARADARMYEDKAAGR